MIKTYTYKIKPNKAVERKFEEQSGICRYVFNLGIEVREEAFKKGVKLNYFDLAKQLTEAKKEFEWLKKVHSQTLQASLERLELGYKKFFADLKKGIKTICIEPSDYFRSYLDQNLVMTGFDKDCEVINALVSTTRNAKKLNLYQGTATVSEEVSVIEKSENIVNCLTLDEICMDRPDIEFIKIDNIITFR
jgi:hypothetical protein